MVPGRIYTPAPRALPGRTSVVSADPLHLRPLTSATVATPKDGPTEPHTPAKLLSDRTSSQPLFAVTHNRNIVIVWILASMTAVTAVTGHSLVRQCCSKMKENKGYDATEIRWLPAIQLGQRCVDKGATATVSMVLNERSDSPVTHPRPRT